MTREHAKQRMLTMRKFFTFHEREALDVFELCEICHNSTEIASPKMCIECDGGGRLKFALFFAAKKDLNAFLSPNTFQIVN